MLSHMLAHRSTNSEMLSFVDAKVPLRVQPESLSALLLKLET